MYSHSPGVCPRADKALSSTLTPQTVQLHFSSPSSVQVGISSTCTVFAESEVISQLANDTDKCDIINGIHMSVAGRVAGLAHRVGVQDRVVMTGGVAQNSGVVKALEDQLGHKVHTSPLTQYVGALGAALFAYKRCKK